MTDEMKLRKRATFSLDRDTLRSIAKTSVFAIEILNA